MGGGGVGRGGGEGVLKYYTTDGKYDFAFTGCYCLAGTIFGAREATLLA